MATALLSLARGTFAGFWYEPGLGPINRLGRSIPHRQHCLPVVAHPGPAAAFTLGRARRRPPRPQAPIPGPGASPQRWYGGRAQASRVRSLGMGRGVLDPPHRTAPRHCSTARAQQGPGYPEGNCGGNQLPGGSMSLSPLPAALGRTICTSVSLLASTAVSHGFAMPAGSSPPFGTQRRG